MAQSWVTLDLTQHDHGGNHITKGIGHADERGHIMLAPRTDFMDLLGSTACQHSARLRVHEHPCFISIPDAVGGNIVGRNQVVEVVEVSHNGIARYRATRSIQAGALSISNLRVSLPEPLQPSLCQGLGSRPSKVDMNLGGDSDKHCRSNCHIAILHVEHPLLHALFAFCRESCLDTSLGGLDHTLSMPSNDRGIDSKVRQPFASSSGPNSQPVLQRQ